MPDSVKLFPCPFCGSTQIRISKYHIETAVTAFYSVGCDDHSLEGYHNAKEAADAWNTRPEQVE